MIHIYSYDIRQSNPALERAAFQVLNIKKRKRIKKYVQNKDKLLSIYGNSLLRYSLSSQGNVLSNKKILENEYGKPYLSDDSIFFNISHSGTKVICATSIKPIGIDIQKKRNQYSSIISFFHKKEKELLQAASHSQNSDLFFKIWTYKESYIKYLGVGLSKPLNSFYVDFSKKQIVDQGISKNLTINSLNFGFDYAAAVVAEEEGSFNFQKVTNKNIFESLIY